jgi:adenylate cyclase class 1
MSIAGRLHELFDDVIDYFYNRSLPDTTRYILQIGKNFHSIYFDQDVFNHKKIGGYAALLRYLSEANSKFSPVIIDRYAMTKSPLPIIYRHNKPNAIQIFYSIEGRNINTYVVDEKGSLFFQSIKNTTEDIFLNQYSRFLESVIHKQQIQIVSPEHDPLLGGNTTINFYQMANNQNGVTRLIPREYNTTSNKQDYFNLHIIADIEDEGQTAFTLFCNDREFTSLEFGDRLFNEVANDVLSHRHSGSIYPIHITDIEFSRPQIGKEQTANLQTIYSLVYKRNIEDKLNQALAALTNSSGSQAQG